MKLYTPEHYADPTGAMAVASVLGAPRFNANREWPVVYICVPGDHRRYCRLAVGNGYLPVAPAILERSRCVQPTEFHQHEGRSPDA